jgi:hypothetical protein
MPRLETRRSVGATRAEPRGGIRPRLGWEAGLERATGVEPRGSTRPRLSREADRLYSISTVIATVQTYVKGIQIQI